MADCEKTFLVMTFYLLKTKYLYTFWSKAMAYKVNIPKINRLKYPIINCSTNTKISKVIGLLRLVISTTISCITSSGVLNALDELDGAKLDLV